MKLFASLFSLAILSMASLLEAHPHVVVVERPCPRPVVVVGRPCPVAVQPVVVQPVVVNEAPPALIQEVITPSPGPNYICINGHWAWEGRWVWKRHEWVAKPNPYASWEPAHWHYSHHSGGYVWQPGHWR